MEIKKEKLSWIENVTKKITQIDVDLDVIVPDSKPDIKRILQVDADIDAASCDMQNDRVVLSGNVCFNIVYQPEEISRIQSIKVNAPFTDVVTVNSVTPEMDGIYNADILSVNYKIINGRKFSVKSVVEGEICVKDTVSAEPVAMIDDCDIQVKNTNVDLLMKVARCNQQININERIVVPDAEPAIGEVLKATGKLNEYTVKLINNKAIVKGESKIVCTYVDAVNEEINTINSVVPFTEIFDLDGVNSDDICISRIQAKICEFNCAENLDGETRSVEIKCVLDVEISVMRDLKSMVVHDCYSVSQNIEMKTLNNRIPKRVADVNYNDTLKTSISVENDDPLIERIYEVFSKAYIEDVSFNKDCLVVKGVVDNYVLYVTQDKNVPIFCLKNEIDFSQEFDCKGCNSPEGEFFAEVLNTSYVLTADNTVDLRINLRINGIIYDYRNVNLVTDIKTSEINQIPETASITVYFVQDNESLWDVAKKYFTTIDAIVKVNELSDGEVESGMRLLIPKHKRV